MRAKNPGEHMKKRILMTVLILMAVLSSNAQAPQNLQHAIAAIEKDRFNGWPANNGIWQWGEEILVGFTQGDYISNDGHNISGVQESQFARSLDDGTNWQMFDPDNFLDDENIKWLPAGKKSLPKALNFQKKGFALRVFATGYHGNDDPAGGFYYSYDRGSTWNGPFFIGGLDTISQLKDLAFSARTDYIVTGKKEMYLFISASDGKVARLGCLKTTNGAQSFEFISWITPKDSLSNAIMTSTVELSEGRFITTFRKIIPSVKNKKGNSIETFLSEDYCRSWKPVSTVKLFDSSSNPPALTKLKDGSILCVYGDRHNGVMAGKYSMDEGKTWGPEFIFRDAFKDVNSDWDFGYPRVVQATNGSIVCLYYWATAEHPQQHIAVSSWDPPIP